MKGTQLLLGAGFIICLLASVVAVGAWVFGYAHGEGAGVATGALMFLTLLLGQGVFELGRPSKEKKTETPPQE